jgi:hypothetical protein
LALFGVQKPGDPFWTETTLRRTQARYPNWDMTLWREAMTKGASSETRADTKVEA